MPRKIYLDESGDLGWTLNAPFRNGGSSKYLTIAFIIIPEDSNHLIKRFVKNIYKHYGFDPTKEIKANKLNPEQKLYIANSIVIFMNRHPDFIIGAITVNKTNVGTHIRLDGNKLYNYMMRLSILDKIHTRPVVKVIRDERSIKVKSGNCCIDYLQTYVWFEMESPCILMDFPSESHRNICLIFIDWVTNIIWGRYEDNKIEPFNVLLPVIRNQKLFF